MLERPPRERQGAPVREGCLSSWEAIHYGRHFSGRNNGGMSVLFTPFTVILSGMAALPQIQATGTRGVSATTAGRSVSTLPWIDLLALLPKVMWIAPSCSVTALT